MKLIKVSILLCVLFSLLWLFYCFITLPDIRGLGNKTRTPSISILDEKENIVGSLGDVYAGSINISEVSNNLINAVLVTEDKRFYSHYGIDFKGLMRAIIFNFKERRYAQGASTITQQLSKLIFLNADKNLSRKIRELMIAFYLEYRFSKREILSLYLNRAYFGSGLYGIKAGARRYFSKDPSKLTIAQSATLAVVLKARSCLSPLVNKKASIKRAKVVVSMMHKNNMINNNEKLAAYIELDNNKEENNKFIFTNSRYFIDWIYSQTPDEVLRSKKDLLIKSTLNTKIQEIVNNSVEIETKNIDSNIQVSVVVMDYRGSVLAMKGGKDWNISKYNRATQSKRQIGSIFKTYVYLTAFDFGFSINDYISDDPIKNKKWSPKNFGNKYEGNITIKRAFAKSSNVAAVRIVEEIGRSFIIKKAQRLGITSHIPDKPSMPLGVSSMSLLEVVGSFGAICGNGKSIIPYGIKEIILRNGTSYWKRIKPNRKKVIDTNTQNKIKILLHSVIKEGTGIKLSKMPFKIYGKTGTSQNSRDAWFIGCAKGYIIGVWNGRDDDKSMYNIYGSTLPLNIFKRIVKKI